jgi:hypothetical protein
MQAGLLGIRVPLCFDQLDAAIAGFLGAKEVAIGESERHLSETWTGFQMG